MKRDETYWLGVGKLARTLKDQHGYTLLLAEPYSTVKTSHGLWQGEYAFSHILNDLENEMFRSGGPKDISIFYGHQHAPVSRERPPYLSRKRGGRTLTLEKYQEIKSEIDLCQDLADRLCSELVEVPKSVTRYLRHLQRARADLDERLTYCGLRGTNQNPPNTAMMFLTPEQELTYGWYRHRLYTNRIDRGLAKYELEEFALIAAIVFEYDRSAPKYHRYTIHVFGLRDDDLEHSRIPDTHRRTWPSEAVTWNEIKALAHTGTYIAQLQERVERLNRKSRVV